MPMLVSAHANRFRRLGSTGRDFAARVPRYEAEAAKVATETSRVVFARWHSGRPLAPARPGRPTTSGAFATLLRWEPAPNGVRFNAVELEEVAPYWIIQEIGTGETAVVWGVGGNTTGVTVKTQIGRRLPRGFYWGDDGGANPTRNTAESRRDIPAPFRSLTRRISPLGISTGQQQLYPISMAPAGSMVHPARGRIRREIIGKHFVRDGGAAGWQMFREQLMAEYDALRR